MYSKLEFVYLIIIWVCIWNLFEVLIRFISDKTKINYYILLLVVLVILFISYNHLFNNDDFLNL